MTEGLSPSLQKMVYFVRYYVATGEIYSSGYCAKIDAGRQPNPNLVGVAACQIVESVPADTSLYYVKDGTLELRPPYPATIDGNVISGLVVPSAMWINRRPFEVTTETLTLNFPNPGSYSVEIESWPYLNFKTEVIV